MKRFNYLLTFVFFAFFVTLKANAELPDTINVRQDSTESENLHGTEYNYALKLGNINGSSKVMLCTEYNTKFPVNKSVACKKNNDWDEATRAGVAAIINEVSNISTTDLIAENLVSSLAINEFLYRKKNTGFHITGFHIEESKLGSHVGMFSDYLQKAKEAVDDYNSQFTLSDNYLVFEKVGSEYISNSITVNGTSNFEVVSNYGTFYKTGNSFKIKVDEDELPANGNVTATVSSTKQINQARNYTCTDEEGVKKQSLTPNVFETISKTSKINVTGTIEQEGTIVIKKVDKSGKYLKGSKIQIKCLSEACTYQDTITTNGSEYTIENLQKGVYLIKEIEAPAGYLLNTTGKTVRIDDSNLYHEVEILNTMTKLEVDVPDTLNSKSALLIAISMFDIALGIGIISYVKKNKIEEQ